MKKVFVILLLTISFTAYSTTYYIDPSGQDLASNNGSKSSPWKTLSYACSRVKTAGDIIHVNAGTYRETVQSLLTAGVSIEGEGVSSNIISTISRLGSYTILLSSSTEAANGNQHISNIKMDGSSLTAYGAIKVAYRRNVEINNCLFIDFNYYGVSFINGEPPSTYATGNKFHDNTVINCSGYFDGNMGSLEIKGQDGMLIYNNNMTQNRGNGLNGVIIFGVEGYLKNVKIYNNTLNKTYVPGTTPWDFAIELWNCQGGVEIYNNTITGSIDLVYTRAASPYSVWIHDNRIGQPALTPSESTRGVLLESDERDIRIERNHIKNVASGIYLDQFGSAKTVSNIYINTNIFSNIGVSLDGANSKGWGIVWTDEEYKNHTVNNINICNNVIIGQSGGRSTMWGINLPNIGKATNITIRNNIIKDFDYAAIYASTQTGAETINYLSIENNIFYQNGNNNLPRYSGITPTNNTTRNNIISNPLFVSSSDFHLQSGSPAIGKGLKVEGITIDFEGATFTDPPPIGAYQYFSPALPVYQSSMIANDAPAILEMTFNISLANIIPATSSFNVLVNSVARHVNSVSISGSKVRLTLASAVVAGDVITVSYTKPSVNPIQTPAGGQADNISSKSVSNNVISVVPVYSGSVIENLTPSVLEMTYTLNLANVIPATAAFNVQVNSVARNVNSVTISGTRVRLALSSPVKFGDIVTVTYTKPSVNPLQGTSGAESASISSKPVTNNLADPAKPNDPPIVVISNDQESFSGFVGQIDASGTYDLNNDVLTYRWTIPDGVEVSSSTEAKIRFLAPEVDSASTITFQLKVSDGLSTVSKSIEIAILPYKPEIPRAWIYNVEASAYEADNYPKNIMDGDFTSNWTSKGDNHWLLLKLSGAYDISHVEISFLKGQMNTSTFDIYASPDSLIWDPILVEASSCGFSGNPQVFDFPDPLTKKQYSYIKIIGHGNSQDDANIISELKIFGTSIKINTLRNEVVIYPNPVLDYFNIAISDEMIFPDAVRIYDLSGKIVYENFYGSGVINIQIPSNIKSGIYIVKLTSGPITLYAQQIVVKRQ